jgi:hypothetical protein
MTSLLTRRRHRRRRAFIEGYEFPMALRNKLREELDDDRPVNVALEGLREWYLVCLDAGPNAMLGMPSRAVDIAWHEMILMTRAYHHFCERAFGYYLHHSPEAVMDEPMRDGLARTLAVLESQSLTLAGVPLLFAIDGELRLPDGQSWEESDIAALRSHMRYVDGGSAGFSGGYYGPYASCASSGPGCGGGGGGCGGGGCGGGG